MIQSWSGHTHGIILTGMELQMQHMNNSILGLMHGPTYILLIFITNLRLIIRTILITLLGTHHL